MPRQKQRDKAISTRDLLASENDYGSALDRPVIACTVIAVPGRLSEKIVCFKYPSGVNAGQKGPAEGRQSLPERKR
jgi:hypothetical protein